MAVVGNEDGAHAVTADMAEALNDVKFPVPAKPGTFRVGEALDTADYQDFEQAPGRSGSPRPVRRAALPISCGRCALSPTWPTALGADGRTSELDRRLFQLDPTRPRHRHSWAPLPIRSWVSRCPSSAGPEASRAKP